VLQVCVTPKAATMNEYADELQKFDQQNVYDASEEEGDMPQKFYKIFTHDFCSPLQKGKPVWDGSVPFDLPQVALDTSDAECAAGWNFVDSIGGGFKIAGMWPTGRPAVVAVVQANGDAIHRNNKWRSSTLKITRIAREIEIAQAIQSFSEVFGEHKNEMANEQIAWRYALGRPENKKEAVVENLEKALAHRDLKWKLKEYKTAWDARAARAAWDVWDARAARDAWAARAARDARDARAAWDARAARAAWDAWDARAAWDARDALILFFAAKQRWIKESADLLTVGLRDAYANGLEIALPVAKKTLGYALTDGAKEHP
jgi:hypothetical protein